MAIRLQPDFTKAHLMLGVAFFRKGLLDEAILQYQKAIELQPDFTFAYFHLGDAFLKKGLLDEAILQYQKAIELQPNFTQAHINLGHTFLQKGQPDEAIIQYQKAIEIQPAAAVAYNGLGDAFRAQGKATEAIASYRKATEIQPRFLKPLVDLAWMLSTWPEASVRNGNEAVALMVEASQLSGGKDPGILRTLAAAYAETGRFDDAVATANKALGAAGDQSDIELKNKLEAEIRRYQTHSACRSTND
jgi:superkiller protein 3